MSASTNTTDATAMPTRRSLANKTALVTGASGGIGQATALELARRGARVAVHYFSKPDAAEATVKTIREAGGEAAAVGADVRERHAVERLVRETETLLGPIDLLVNNAGDLVRRAPLLEMSDELWHDVIDRNLTSVFLCTQIVARGMMSRRAGVIVNMSSVAAHNGGGPGAFAYAAAKAGVIALTKAWAKELAPHGIRVNSVAPGLIGDTAFHARFTPKEAFEAASRGVPLGRAGTPDEVALVIAFLCDHESTYLTGETIDITGGLWMR
jgi:3-oxoacyl-[acyl-carrier protein] reductase